MKTILTFCLAATIALGLTACKPNDHANMHHDSGAHSTEQIVISAARVVPPFPGRDVSAGYFEVTNHGSNDRLVSIESSLSPRTEMHTHLNEDGVMKMRKVEGVDLPPGETVTFKPGSYHIMMFGVALDEQQADAALTFNFETAPSVTVIADIEGRGDNGEDKHQGH